MLEEILNLINSEVAKQSLGAGEHQLEFAANSVRCAIPVRAVSALTRAGVPVEPVTRAEGDPEMEPAVDNAPMIEFTLSGTASSTSVDAYGTEMSRACLDNMAEQFSAGIEVFVGHGSMFEGLEWDKAIGMTTKGEVLDAQVVNAADQKEPGAVCTVEMHFSADEDSTAFLKDALRTLKKRIEKGLATGLSIGGWFRGVTYVVDDEGYLSRIIINKVDLDHLATTRRPANPDCLDMAMVRTALTNALKARSAPAEPVALTTRASDPKRPTRRELDPKSPRLEDSKYEQPPHDYVTDIKANYPDIWKEGGNIRGNDAYGLWTMYLDGDRSEEVLDWVVEREGWAARHFEDFELPGVMAQLKWGVIGSKGWDHQKKVIEDAKAEADAEEEGKDEAEDSNKPDEEMADPEPTPAAQPANEPDSNLSNPVLDPNERAASPLATNPELPAQRGEEIDMTPEQLKAEIEAAFIARGLGTPPASPDTIDATRTLDDADQRRGAQNTPTPTTPAIKAPVGADLTRSSGVMGVILQNRTHTPDSAAASFKAEVLRSVTFGQDSVDHSGVPAYREPSGTRTKALWLGLSHKLRQEGLNGLADVAERAAPILGVEIRGMRGLKTIADDDKALVDSEARGLFVEAVRAAAADGHPTFQEPGTRPAVQRALTVSAASDKVTTALVSALLQQLSNVQLGARTQLRRIPGAGTSFVTPKRTVSSTLAEFVADGTAPTEDSGTWGNDTWNYKTLATRVKVTRKAVRQGAQWGDLVAAEALNKGEDFNRQEEIAIFQGDAVHSLPTANGFDGLLTLIGVTSGQTVANTTATAGESLNLNKLDDTISKVRGREIKSNLRIFASERGHTLLNTVLQATQQFSNTVMVAAGFIVETYMGIPIVESSGIPDTLVWNGTDTKITKWTTGATTALVVVNLNHAYLCVLTPQTLEQVGTTTAQYVEFEMYCDEVLVLDNALGAAQLGGIKVS